MKSLKYLYLVTVMLLFSITLTAEVVEEIYAIVNGEPITKTEFVNAVNAKIQDNNRNAKKKIYSISKKEKTEILNMIIESKILLAKAKLKDYDVNNDVKLWINEIKKQNNFKSDKELEAAIMSQGINMTLEQFLDNKKTQIMQQRLIQEEVSRNVTVDNSEIMEYFKKNKKEYMTPLTIELNCIFLTKKDTVKEMQEQKMKEISEKLKKNNFKDIAKEYSQLTTDPKTNFYLGKFKKGELDKKLEENALKLKRNTYSNWIENDNGWYILQLIKKEEPKFIEYKTVSGKIKNQIFVKKSKIELKKYIKKLKKNSNIEVFVKF
jgi:parvulin-like peptidyl-prolyl isomerase